MKSASIVLRRITVAAGGRSTGTVSSISACVTVLRFIACTIICVSAGIATTRTAAAAAAAAAAARCCTHRSNTATCGTNAASIASIASNHRCAVACSIGLTAGTGRWRSWGSATGDWGWSWGTVATTAASARCLTHRSNITTSLSCTNAASIASIAGNQRCAVACSIGLTTRIGRRSWGWGSATRIADCSSSACKVGAVI